MRFVFLVIRLLVIFGLVRFVIGFVVKLVRQTMGTGTLPRSAAPEMREPSGMQSAGELRKDPVCGTFIPIGTSLKKTVNGEIVHFCSADCRDRFKVA